MSKYIGFKMIEAEPMTLGDYNTLRGWTIPADEDPAREGYKVVYPDGYVSWSPKEIFESAYMQVGDNNTVTPDIVDGFIKDIEVTKMGRKTTVVKATLLNGFEIVKGSSCVDPANYDEKIGTQVCLNSIKDEMWKLLGFLLQTAKEGIK